MLVDYLLSALRCCLFSVFVATRHFYWSVDTRYNIASVHHFIVLGSLVVIVLAIGPEDRGLTPGRGRSKSVARLPSEEK
jgi:hypothetical protein